MAAIPTPQWVTLRPGRDTNLLLTLHKRVRRDADDSQRAALAPSGQAKSLHRPRRPRTLLPTLPRPWRGHLPTELSGQ